MSDRMSISYSVVRESVIAVSLDGILDSGTYLETRDAIIKAAVEEPDLVVVQIDRLNLPAESALAVFTSARWHVADWPDVPVSIVTDDNRLRDAMARNGVTRQVRCVRTIDEAVSTAQETPPRRRAVCSLDSMLDRRPRARVFVTRKLRDWSMSSYVDIAKVVVTELLDIMGGAPQRGRIRLEARGNLLWVTVRDDDAELPVRVESPAGTAMYSAPGLLTSIVRRWGAAPDIAGGRIVWAAVGPENRI